MEVYTKRRWHVYKWDTNFVIPEWRQYGQSHLTDWEARDWAKENLPSGTRFRIVEVFWVPEVNYIQELTVQ